MGKTKSRSSVKYIGTGQGQIGTQPDNDLFGRFFAVFKSGEEIEIPDSLADEIRVSRDAWKSRGFELIES
jgi:hypothetical protein